MKKYIILVLFVTVICAATAVSARIKEADLAGSWYPDSEEKLLSQLNQYLAGAAAPKIGGEIIGIIAPHAGYVYSGPVAAYSYNAVKGREIETVIIIGFSHRKYYDGIAVFDGEAYRTPLGQVSINQGLTKKLTGQNKKIYAYPPAFDGENSVEMQIPFLQATLKNFDMVLVAIGDQSYDNSRILADALYNALKDRQKYLLVLSTDMCHYLPYEEANKIDNSTISLIKEFEPQKFYTESLSENHRLMCGYGAVTGGMLAAKLLGADKIEILKYANSGDITGSKGEVVGYLSAAIYKENQPFDKLRVDPFDKLRVDPERSRMGQESKIKGEKGMLSEKQKKRLLQIAREAMEAYVKTDKKLDFKEDDPLLNREMGAFVTLHYRGELRGCIGNIIGRGPLYLTVRDMAIESSTDDPRFSPVQPEELKDISVEISVLSELEKIDDPAVIEMGRHGVLVRSGFRSGVFLPQVATETGWGLEEFMSNLCSHKAGLRPDAWKKGGCEIYIFTAEVFGEK